VSLSPESRRAAAPRGIEIDGTSSEGGTTVYQTTGDPPAPKQDGPGKQVEIGVYGWGIVAPRSPDMESFARNLEGAESWLTPFNGFGPDNFLVGEPEFDFERYRGWIEARFPANRFSQLTGKMDPTTLYAVGAFIQSLEQNEGMESLLRELGTEAHVYVGTGLGALPTLHDASLGLVRAQRTWDRFWSDAQRNPAHARYLENPDGVRAELPGMPVDPATVEDPDAAADARLAWYGFWAARSEALATFLRELADIEGISIGGEVEGGKIAVIRSKERQKARLLERWGAPTPPWSSVSTNLLWNIQNTPASQISMLGHITGLAFAPVAACSTFGVCLKLAMDAIRRGEARAVVVGATDPPPHPLSVGAFYGARVLSADRGASKPLSGLRGTHVAGGSMIWIVGDRAFMESRGMRPLGMEPVSVGVSSDADHIITPSTEGPTEAIRMALAEAGVDAADLGSWDLHATATPGDFLEVETLRRVVPEQVLVTARKGTFGHGMSVGGGWELTAQYLGMERGVLFPTPLTAAELNREIGSVHDRWVFNTACPAPRAPMGKLSMGVGGVNACVVSRPLDAPDRDEDARA
jgi:3-oxoacyl-[acyl-carrier-protein] synthase II